MSPEKPTPGPSDGKSTPLANEEIQTLLTLAAEETVDKNTVAQFQSSSAISNEMMMRLYTQQQRCASFKLFMQELEEMDAASTQLTREEIQANQCSLTEQHQQFLEGHEWLMKHWPATQTHYPYFKDEAFLQEEVLVRKARRILGRMESGGSKTSTVPPSQTAEMYSKLPEVTIPTFNGEIRSWLNFKELFTSLVISRKDIDGLIKLHYLKEAVTDSAANLISHLPLVESSFQAAWDILTNRFDSKQLQVRSYTDRILKMEPLEEESPALLIQMTNAINETTQALKSLGLHDRHNVFLLEYMVSLLDDNTRVHWEFSRGSSQEMPTIEEFSAFLLTRARALAAIEKDDPIKSSSEVPRQ